MKDNRPRPAPWEYPFLDHRNQRQVREDEQRTARKQPA
jgi:hypothetical protein